MKGRLLLHGAACLAALVLAMLLSTATAGAQAMGDSTGRDSTFNWYFGGRFQSITTHGIVVIDTAGRGMAGGMMTGTNPWNLRYFLDTTGVRDTTGTAKNRNYQLFFGPFWYNPTSGAMRPKSGDSVTVTGGLDTAAHPPVIVVYNLNSMIWRDPQGAPPWGGKWIRGLGKDTIIVTDPLDSLTHIIFPPHALGRGGDSLGGVVWPDSIFAMLEQRFRDGLSGFSPRDSALIVYHLGLFTPTGRTLNPGGLLGTRGITFRDSIQLQFHILMDSLKVWRATLRDIIVRYRDGDSVWVRVRNARTDTSKGVVIITDSTVHQEYAISLTTPTGVEEVSNAVPETYTLSQNYPNPFNPATTIAFDIPKSGFVTLEVYNTLGQHLATLVSGELAAGSYRVTWNASALPSGAYFYRMKVGSFVSTKTAVLVK